ncbi:MAG: undecaprenyl/decaprenyl-phosphate alpha-N-acetylglucosaminyl 1-phosphate transferase [Oscillibacter sp.]|nr:undecaprenyl/decaprenyl-phosphate alpha-N-acetylglucosaminyl 1-phosphate transferase [Oscillibacter sp.]MBD5168796.1 undecaprenyl/decaprenyl-phosphate alpha-N-acetylglucosaminyl 1-phosphate transferase [Oscillibacter sp.]
MNGFFDRQSALPVILSLAVSLVVSFCLTPAVKWLAVKIGAVDVPKDKRRMHDHPIPRLGGLAIFIGFVVAVLAFADVDRQLRGILLGGCIIVAVGIVDDSHPLGAGIKFILQIVAALIAVWHGVLIEMIANPLPFGAQYWDFGIMAVPITVIWIVAVTNSVNLIDGLDGLADGVSTIAALTMLIIALLMGDMEMAVLCAALVGGCIGFIPYNRNPAKIFMGDTGATFLGFVLATVSVTGLFKLYAVISFVVPFIILGFPIFDTVSAFTRRILKGQNPMKADRSHTHHKLIDMGMNQKQAVATLYMVAGVLGLCAVMIVTSGYVKVILSIAALVGTAYTVARIIRYPHEHPKQETPVEEQPDKKED